MKRGRGTTDRLGSFPGRSGRGPRRLRHLGAPRTGRGAEQLTTCSAKRRRSGLFDILAHPDLVKVWGTDPCATTSTPRADDIAMPANRARQRRDRGFDGRPAEAGRGDGIGRATCRDVRRAGKPIALSSDAHEPRKRSAMGYDEAVALLRDVGVDRISVFEAAGPPRGAARMSGSPRTASGTTPPGSRSRRPAGARGRGAPSEAGLAGTRTPMSFARYDRRVARGGWARHIGDHFPDHDPRWADANSVELLIVAGMLTDEGWRTANADVTVIAESPRLGPPEGADEGPAGGCNRRRARLREREGHDERGDGRCGAR